MSQQTATEKLTYQCSLNSSIADTISSVSWTVTPTGPTIAGGGVASNTSTVQVSGISVGKSYVLNCHMVGAIGEYDGSIEIYGIQYRGLGG